MKKLRLLFITLLFSVSIYFLSCNNNQKQALASIDTAESTTTDNTAAQNLKVAEDTIVTDISQVAGTPYIEKPEEYFRQNNRYKDWDKNDKQKVFIGYITDKDGKNSNVTVKKSSGIQKLDDEAIRLVQNMKYDEPAFDFNHNPIKIGNMAIVIHFPPK